VSAVTVSPMTLEDAPAVQAMALEFIRSTSYWRDVPESSIQPTLATMMQSGVVLVARRAGAPVGFVMGAVFTHFMTQKVTASETAWWVTPDARDGLVARRLMRAFEAFARERGATVLEAGSWHARLDKLFTRMGFVPAERVFRKEL
jgi:GNAT superfamily N-acetyltransferase